MPFCTLCDKERDKLEMIKDKEQPDGIGTICVFCRDEMRRLRELRTSVYNDSFAELSTSSIKDLSLKAMMKTIEKTIFTTAIKYADSVSEMARVLGMERSTLAMKIAAANMQIKNGVIIDRVDARVLSRRFGMLDKGKPEVWRARISINSDRLFLGKFDTKEEADHVYRTAHYLQTQYDRNNRAGFIAMVLKKAAGDIHAN